MLEPADLGVSVFHGREATDSLILKSSKAIEKGLDKIVHGLPDHAKFFSPYLKVTKNSSV